MYNQKLSIPSFPLLLHSTVSTLVLPVKFVPIDAYDLLYTPFNIRFCGKISKISPLTYETLICPKLNQYSSKLLLLVPYFLVT